jgi:hypothetical protein
VRSMFHGAKALARVAPGDKAAKEPAQAGKTDRPTEAGIADGAGRGRANQAAGVEIRRDGTVIDPAAWTKAIPDRRSGRAHDRGTDGQGSASLARRGVTIEAKPEHHDRCRCTSYARRGPDGRATAAMLGRAAVARVKPRWGPGLARA